MSRSYVDAREEKRIVAIKPAFRPVFLVATTKEGSGIELLTSEPPQEVTAPEARPCFWWQMLDQPSCSGILRCGHLPDQIPLAIIGDREDADGPLGHELQLFCRKVTLSLGNRRRG